MMAITTSNSMRVKRWLELVASENFLFTGKEGFRFPPNPLSLSKKSGVFWGRKSGVFLSVLFCTFLYFFIYTINHKKINFVVFKKENRTKDFSLLGGSGRIVDSVGFSLVL